MATILRVSDRQRLEPYHEPSNVSIKALLGDRHELAEDFFDFWQDSDTMYSMYQRPRRLKSLKGVRGVNEPGYLKQHPLGQYTFVGLSPVQGSYSARSLIRIPQSGFDRCSSSGLSCGETLLQTPPCHWESSRINKPLFIPVRSSTCSSPRKTHRHKPDDNGYSYYGNKNNMCTTTGHSTERTRAYNVSYKSRENSPRSQFKVPRVTPVTTATPISITLDVSIMRKDSLGDFSAS